MSIFHRAKPAEVFRHFTHKGWLGLCPVWLNQRSGNVTERNWIPEWWMTANIAVLDTLAVWSATSSGSTPGTAGPS